MKQKLTVTQAAQLLFPEVQKQIKESSARPQGLHSMHLNQKSPKFKSKPQIFTSFGNNVIRNKLIQLNRLKISPKRFYLSVSKQNFQMLNNVLLQDVHGTKNQYLNEKARVFAKRAYNSINTSQQQIELNSYINKNQSYISRIDRLYKKQQQRYRQMMSQIRDKYSCKFNSNNILN